VCTICIVYIHFYTVYLFIYNGNIYIYIYKRFTSLVFGTVHSDRTLVVLLHKHFSSCLTTLCNFVNSITYCMYANTSESDIMAYVNNFFAFSSWFIMSHFSSVLIAFDRFFT
jgi:hypothetical protein